jgi:hypothetical protein
MTLWLGTHEPFGRMTFILSYWFKIILSNRYKILKAVKLSRLTYLNLNQ